MEGPGKTDTLHSFVVAPKSTTKRRSRCDAGGQKGVVPTSIYTDGSKIDRGVGAVWSKWENGREKKWKTKLAPHCAVYPAELAALVDAVREAVIAGTDMNICSDSRSLLEAIAGGHSDKPADTWWIAVNRVQI
ncbi:unnamed protein product [Pieris macdunnoughi]|uniref:RNase H type-1 domain-containing protein n=1 Tax=Pieris macdunnoughi TaxID=345717 RepID=A0A821XU59_9NEOP|nr:unnamed protein product [Pieris macdunnoughi]